MANQASKPRSLHVMHGCVLFEIHCVAMTKIKIKSIHDKHGVIEQTAFGMHATNAPIAEVGDVNRCADEAQ
jgi:hypothetical protein